VGCGLSTSNKAHKSITKLCEVASSLAVMPLQRVMKVMAGLSCGAEVGIGMMLTGVKVAWPRRRAYPDAPPAILSGAFN